MTDHPGQARAQRPLHESAHPGTTEPNRVHRSPGRPCKARAAPSRRDDVELIVLVALLAAIGPLSIDTYLPAMPDIAREFGVTSSIIEQSLSAFFLGIAAGQLIAGPLSDRFGRRPVLFAGLGIYLLATLACAFAPSAGALIAARLVQGLGASALPAASRAVIRDVWSGNRAARAMSFVMIVMSFAPLLAPLLGGQIHAHFGWRAIFWLMLGFALVLIAATWFRLPETNGAERRGGVHLASHFRAYGSVLASARAWAYLLTGGLTYAIMFAYITGAPHVYIGFFGVSPEVFGFYFALNVIGLTAGNWINSRYVLRFGYRRMLGWGILASAIGVLILLFFALTQLGGLPAVVISLFIAVAPVSMTGSNAIAGLLDHYPENAGAAAALFGVGQFGLSAVAGVLVGLLYSGTASAMAWAMTITAAGAAIAWLWLQRCESRSMDGAGGSRSSVP